MSSINYYEVCDGTSLTIPMGKNAPAITLAFSCHSNPYNLLAISYSFKSNGENMEFLNGGVAIDESTGLQTVYLMFKENSANPSPDGTIEISEEFQTFDVCASKFLSVIYNPKQEKPEAITLPDSTSVLIRTKP